MLTTPITEAVYPRIVAGLHSSRAETLRFARLLLLRGSFVLACAAAVLAVIAMPLGQLISADGSGAEISAAITVLAPVPLLIFINNICGTQILVGLGHTAIFRNCVVAAGLMVPIICFALMKPFGFLAGPLSTLFGEILIAAMMTLLSLRMAGNWITQKY
jgi:PST family polysaccharide transporter